MGSIDTTKGVVTVKVMTATTLVVTTSVTNRVVETVSCSYAEQVTTFF